LDLAKKKHNQKAIDILSSRAKIAPPVWRKSPEAGVAELSEEM